MKRFPVVHALAVILAMFVLGMAGTADAVQMNVHNPFNAPFGGNATRMNTLPSTRSATWKSV